MGWSITLLFLGAFRLLALSLSFALSTLCAAIFFTFVLFLGSDAGWLQEDPLTAVGAVGFAGASWLAIAQTAFAPSCLVFVLLELSRGKSLVINLLSGGAIAFAAVLFAQGGSTVEFDLPYPDREIWAAIISAGFVAGFCHWVLAGHRAGNWMGTPVQEN